MTRKYKMAFVVLKDKNKQKGIQVEWMKEKMSSTFLQVDETTTTSVTMIEWNSSKSTFVSKVRSFP